jgi:hypothetical protein
VRHTDDITAEPQILTCEWGDTQIQHKFDIWKKKNSKKFAAFTRDWRPGINLRYALAGKPSSLDLWLPSILQANHLQHCIVRIVCLDFPPNSRHFVPIRLTGRAVFGGLGRSPRPSPSELLPNVLAKRTYLPRNPREAYARSNPISLSLSKLRDLAKPPRNRDPFSSETLCCACLLSVCTRHS